MSSLQFDRTELPTRGTIDDDGVILAPVTPEEIMEEILRPETQEEEEGRLLIYTIIFGLICMSATLIILIIHGLTS